MTDSDTDRCGYESTSTDDSTSSLTCCCYRSTLQKSPRCAWHADTAAKTVSDIPDIRNHDSDSRPQTHVNGNSRRVNSILVEPDLSTLRVDNAVSFDDVALHRAALAEASLNGTGFSQAVLIQSDLSEATLQGADFADAIFEDVTLAGANLERAVLAGAQLETVNLSGANVFEADFRDTEIRDADLSETLGEETRFSNAEIESGCFTGAELTAADFSGAELRGADFTDATLQDADFSDAELQDADFNGADLTEVTFRNADLEGVTFDDADLSETTLTGADCEDAEFREATLTRAALDGADLTGADLTGAHLFGATFDGTRISSRTKLVTDGPIGDPTVANRCRYDTDVPPSSAAASVGMEQSDVTATDEPAEIVQYRRGRSTYRRLEELARQNGFLELQSTMFKRRQELRRKLLKARGERTKWLFAEVQRWLFVYGESFRRILLVLTAVISLSWVLYLSTGTLQTADGTVVTLGTVTTNPLFVWETFYHSISLFFTGVGVLTPANTAGEVLMALEAISGPVLLALLIFVLGRRAAR